jgi:mono/diheme cytochrome c family protein
MSRRLLPFFAVALSAVAASAFTVGRGGWAVITVEDLPQHLVAGKPVELTFLVRQHGMTLMSGLRPTVFAKSGKAEVQASAISGKKLGSYSSTLVVPTTGDWTITIASGFLNNNVTLAPLAAIGASAAPRVIAAADRGRQLFIAKGCTTCHVHGAVEGSGKVKTGPELTPKRYQAEYLAKLLDDPSIAKTPGQMNTMPKLELKPTEVTALAAFINADRQVSAKQ